jgi:ornithine decarboxylase
MRLKEYTVQTGKYFVFGMYSSQINKLIPDLKENPNINKLGVHFHRKTQNISEWSLIRELKDSLSDQVWSIIDYLDIGGGIPVAYKNITPSVINLIYNNIKELKKFVNSKNIKLIIEPGRAIAAPSTRLITTIINIVDNNIFIDASLFNCSMDTLVAHIKLLVENENTNANTTPYLIKGGSPTSEDIFRYRVYFNENYTPKIGDKIVFLNAGAYIYYTDLFNLEKPEIKFVD